jgi:hypothetical protein
MAHYQTSIPRSLDEDWSANLKAEKARLEKLEAQMKPLEAEAARDPFETVCKLKLTALRPLRNELAAKVRRLEAAAGIAGRDTSRESPAFGAPTNVWRRDLG